MPKKERRKTELYPHVFKRYSTPDLFIAIADLIYGLYAIEPDSNIFYHTSISRMQLLIMAEQMLLALKKKDTMDVPKNPRFFRCPVKDCAFGQEALSSGRCPGQWWSFECSLFQTEAEYQDESQR